MTAQSPGGVDAGEHPSLPVPIDSPGGSGLPLRDGTIELSLQLRADLLNTDAWSDILATYGDEP